MAITKPVKTPGNESVAKMAKIIVDKEVTRIVGPDNAEVLMKIGVLLREVRPLYQQYFDLVDKGTIQLEDVAQHFSPKAWAALPKAKRRLLEDAIKKEVETAKREIASQMQLLDRTEKVMSQLGPKGQEAMLKAMLQLTGAADPEQ